MLAWAVVLPAVVFVATKHIWFDTISSGEKAIFWTNVSVAIGTLALAVATVWNISQTNKVIAGEDRRHQQQFAPLVQFNDYTHGGNDFQSGFSAVNIGNGLAIDITVEVRGLHRFDAPIQFEVTSDEWAAELAEKPNVTWTYRDGRRFAYDIEPRSVAFEGRYTLSALRAGDPYATLYDKRIEDKTSWHGRIEYEHVELTYYDMFGNKYSTIYRDPDIATYKWCRPAHLAMRLPFAVARGKADN